MAVAVTVPHRPGPPARDPRGHLTQHGRHENDRCLTLDLGLCSITPAASSRWSQLAPPRPTSRQRRPQLAPPSRTAHRSRPAARAPASYTNIKRTTVDRGLAGPLLDCLSSRITVPPPSHAESASLSRLRLRIDNYSRYICYNRAVWLRVQRRTQARRRKRAPPRARNSAASEQSRPARRRQQARGIRTLGGAHRARSSGRSSKLSTGVRRCAGRCPPTAS
jgi:hypothetical protein